MSSLLAKNAFLAGVTCTTQGWLVHHAPPAVPGPGLQWRFWVGADVQERARQWLGNGTMLRRTPLEAAIADTQASIAERADHILFETTFSWNGLVTRADAIRQNGVAWDLIEIKSGKSDEEEKIKDEYIDDLAFTRLVAGGAGLNVARCLLVLINRDYRLNGAAEMFVYTDVTDAVNARAQEFSAEVERVAQQVAADSPPEPELIFACRKCDYFESDCLGKGVPDPLFVIPRISEKKFETLKVYGRIADLPKDADLTAIQRGVVDVLQAGTPRVDHDGLAILDSIAWPARYLDFEAVMPHLPWFSDAAPYETVPFQYSLHLLDSADASPQHFEYLAEVEGDWRRDMVERLLRDLGERGSIVVYSGYEKGRLRALAQTFPEFEEPINRVLDRLFDLEQVFKKGYQHPGFGGRTSIKRVLPVMVPELSYKALAVNNGDDALGVFALMRVGAMDEQFIPAQRERLLEYCKLDTWAMVRLHLATMNLRSSSR